MISHPKSNHDSNNKSKSRKIRYAVVGLGHISQVAVLPAFAHAKENSELAALVSSDPKKLAKLGKKYKIADLYSYEQYDECLNSGAIDAIYIALPNHMHREYTVRAAAAGVHVLCEKPMAVTEAECREMIEACEQNEVRLMIAYRLHFDESNLKAVEYCRGKVLGDLKYFSSDFSQQVNPGNVRVDKDKGGGPLYDIGVYCINAARYLFGDEPTEAFGCFTSSNDPRFKEVEETAAVTLRFPEDRVATFTCSFGAADVQSWRMTGTEGDLRMDPAYGYSTKLTHYLTLNGKTKKTAFAKRDQFAPELLYFSQCILKGENPEPSGAEGLADVRIVEAIFRSVVENQPIAIEPVTKHKRPHAGQDIQRPPVSKPELVNVQEPHR